MNKIAKFFKSKWLFLSLVAAALTTCVASAVFVVQTGMDFSPNFETVAVNTATNKEYHRVEAALMDATSGQTVYLKVGTDPVLFNDAEVKSGVIFAIPYQNGVIQLDGNPPEASKASRELATRQKNCVNTLTINPNVTLTVNGTLSIGGMNGGGGSGSRYSGQTASSFGAISMKDNSKIICGTSSSKGIIHCVGYIYDDSPNQNAFIDVVNGDLYEPFIVGDHRGGSGYMAFSQFYEAHKVSPIKRYCVINVQPLFKIRYGSSLIAYCNLYEGTNKSTHYTTGAIVGNTTASLIQLLNANSYFTSDFLPDEVHQGISLDRSKICIYGSADMNSLSISIASIGQIETSQVYFPLTYMQQVHLYPVAGDSNKQTVKSLLQILPGGLLHVHEGVNFYGHTINCLKYTSNGLSKQGFNDQDYNLSGVRYVEAQFDSTHPARTDGVFIVDGNFESTVAVGGYIETQSEQAKMNITGSFAIDAEECISYTPIHIPILESTNDKYVTIHNPLSGKIWPETAKFQAPNRNFTSNGNAWVVNDPEYSIAYKGVLPDGTLKDLRAANLPKFFKENTMNLLIGEGDIIAGHKFSGQWYYDSNCTNTLEGNKLQGNLALPFVNPNNGELTIYGKYNAAAEVTVIYNDGISRGEVITSKNLPASLVKQPGESIILADAAALQYDIRDLFTVGRIIYKAVDWLISKDEEANQIIASNAKSNSQFNLLAEYGNVIYIRPNISEIHEVKISVTHDYINNHNENEFYLKVLNGNSVVYTYTIKGSDRNKEVIFYANVNHSLKIHIKAKGFFEISAYNVTIKKVIDNKYNKSITNKNGEINENLGTIGNDSWMFNLS